MPQKARKSCFLNSYTLPLLLLTTVHWLKGYEMFMDHNMDLLNQVEIKVAPDIHCSKVSGKIKALEGVENCKCTKFPDQKQRYLIQIIAEKSKLHDF